MNLIEKFVSFTQNQMPEPKLYGVMHLLFILLGVIAIVVVCLTCRKLSDKNFNKVLLVTGCSLLFLEVIKQLNFAYDASTDTWEYYWKQFPFQFCSVPMYVMVIVSLLKEGKLKSALCSFLATFGLFAGLVVTLYPATVLSDIIFRFSQSMIHHITMFVVGVLMYVSGRVEFKNKTILRAIPVFAVCVVVAFLINIVFHQFNTQDSFNMFYIGPYSKCDIPVLYDIGRALNIQSESLHFGNFIFVLIYTLGFSVVSYVVLLGAILVKKIYTSKKVIQK